MTLKRRIITALTAGALAATGLTTPAHATTTACTWRSTFLPVPAGAVSGVVSAANGSSTYAGRIGYSTPGGAYEYHVARWTGTTISDLGLLPDAHDELNVNDVNSSGTVVGDAGKVIGEDPWGPVIRSFPFKSSAGHLEQLPVPAGAYNVRAVAVSDNGDIWGNGHPVGDPDHTKVYRWPADQPGTVTTPAGFPFGSAVAGVDTDGTVAFTVTPNPITGTDRPYVWKNGVVTALPMPPGATYAKATAIAGGRVVGESYDAGGATGVVWANGSVSKLPNSRNIYGVSTSGLILGWSLSPFTHALWQLTTALGAVPNGSPVKAIADDSTLLGALSKPGQSSAPAVSRCS
jgi:uncharacterized membrane protein